MSTLKVGIASYEDFKERTMAIARGKLKPSRNDPKVWFTSIESFAKVLSDRNRALLALIAETNPSSMNELAERTGRARSNLSRTLRTMERYGLIRFEKGTGRTQAPRVIYSDVVIHEGIHSSLLEAMNGDRMENLAYESARSSGVICFDGARERQSSIERRDRRLAGRSGRGHAPTRHSARRNSRPTSLRSHGVTPTAASARPMQESEHSASQNFVWDCCGKHSWLCSEATRTLWQNCSSATSFGLGVQSRFDIAALKGRMNAPQSNLIEYTVSELSFALEADGGAEFRARARARRDFRLQGPRRLGPLLFHAEGCRAPRIDAVIFRLEFQKLRFKPQEGLEMVATGRLTTFPSRSRYQIIVDHLEPAGAGALMVLLEERRKKLAAEGLFDASRKKPLPYLPNVIGVVTSPTGAVIRDILHRLRDRFPRRVLVWPVRVQGEGAAEEVAAAVRGFNAIAPGGRFPRPDLLIVARGGGSIEDLWAFNEEVAVRAVAASAIPVISAVGHETDWTLMDHVADLRAPTPTGAAEMAVPVRVELVAVDARAFEPPRAGASPRHGSTAPRCLPRWLGRLPSLGDLLALPRQKLDHVGGRLGRSLLTEVAKKRERYVAVGAPRHAGDPASRRTQQRRERLDADDAARGVGARQPRSASRGAICAARRAPRRRHARSRHRAPPRALRAGRAALPDASRNRVARTRSWRAALPSCSIRAAARCARRSRSRPAIRF